MRFSFPEGESDPAMTALEIRCISMLPPAVLPVSYRDVRDLPLARLIKGARSAIAKRAHLEAVIIPSGEGPIRPDELAAVERAGQKEVARPARRSVTRALLEQVAQIYVADDTGRPTAVVAERIFTSHRNATRYVQLAREQGLIPPYCPQKGMEK
jgi:hypothetical protein